MDEQGEAPPLNSMLRDAVGLCGELEWLLDNIAAQHSLEMPTARVRRIKNDLIRKAEPAA